MRVLLSAFECNPMFGSDPYVGWSWVSNMAKTNDVYVLLRIDHKPYIEKYCAENKIEGYKNIHFIYLPSSELFGKIVYKLIRTGATVSATCRSFWMRSVHITRSVSMWKPRRIW